MKKKVRKTRVMVVQVGKQKVPLQDFIAAVLENTDNQEIKFNIQIANFDAKINFAVS